MSLDLDKVFPQAGDMVIRLKNDAARRQQRLKFALDTMHSQADKISSLAKKIDSGNTTWLIAGLVDGLDRRIEAPPAPAEFSILAADGSHIDVDRHRSPRCYLINIGSVVLRYGSSPAATLESFPSLYSSDEDLVITPTGNNNTREQVVEGTLLGIKRGVDECGKLAELAAELPGDGLSLALVDGTLVLWGLEAYPEFVTEALLDKGFLSHLSSIKELNNKKREVALASYISFPRSTEVVNALRLALCPHDILDTDRHCQDCKDRQCEAVAGIRDCDLFSELLAPGERSCLFTSGSKIIKKYPAEHRIYFFYLRVDDETARVEIPQWVAMDEGLLNLTHSLILDQCRRGQGYPVALSEAHEQAVVTGADRENFWRLVESLLLEENLPSLSSAKSRSKRTRWV
ncbi:MAG: DNA double-strand break repair nuclease NurA [Dehalococcoidales bacterium]|nr:DNA double-strand break repair nuclease NurA [Dehalococcoidales bacterium]